MEETDEGGRGAAGRGVWEGMGSGRSGKLLATLITAFGEFFPGDQRLIHDCVRVSACITFDKQLAVLENDELPNDQSLTSPTFC